LFPPRASDNERAVEGRALELGSSGPPEQAAVMRMADRTDAKELTRGMVILRSDEEAVLFL
jgi:hypothetical protein